MDLKIPEKAKLLQFETNTACDGGCTFCRHSTMKKRPPMPMHRIVDLLYHLAHKATEVCPFFMQEPLLEPRLLPILSNVKLYSPRGRQTLYTNMGRYPEATWRKIIQWGFVDQVMISFYGGCKTVHDRMQPGTPYEQTKRNIRRLIRLRDSLHWKRPQIALAYLVTPETTPQLKRAVEEWVGTLPLAMFRWDSWCGHFPYDAAWEEQFWGPPEERGPCSQLWRGIYVNSLGELLPCCMDCDAEMVVGNVFKDWEAWWNSDKLNEMRMLHMEGRWDEIPMCRVCTKWRCHEDSGEWIKGWTDKIKTLESAPYAASK